MRENKGSSREHLFALPQLGQEGPAISSLKVSDSGDIVRATSYTHPPPESPKPWQNMMVESHSLASIADTTIARAVVVGAAILPGRAVTTFSTLYTGSASKSSIILNVTKHTIAITITIDASPPDLEMDTSKKSPPIKLSLPLAYQQEIFREVYNDDSLVVLARGLGLQQIVANLLHSYDAAGRNLVLLVGAGDLDNTRLGEGESHIDSTPSKIEL
ncbi:hypothetical protein ABW21_db0201995 [Orbilia brochopaga]|nr:hypothetical protein ABW21_db0201995 [Drechslerella brochopaga]